MNGSVMKVVYIEPRVDVRGELGVGVTQEPLRLL